MFLKMSPLLITSRKYDDEASHMRIWAIRQSSAATVPFDKDTHLCHDGVQCTN